MNELKFKESFTYDQISLGEVMLRFDPGEGRIRTSRLFRVSEGGGEYNVARALKKCFKMKTAIITALADNEIGMLLEDCIMQGGVDTSFIKWTKIDGIGRNCRNGLNFTERGFGIRAAVGVSDRANTAISKINSKDIDFEDIFKNKGTKWFHTGGIFAALSDNTFEIAKDAIKTAKKYGSIVSYDLNYRESLWLNNGGVEKARKVNKELVKNVDVLVGNEEDFNLCLGIGDNLKNDEFNEERYLNLVHEIIKEFPNLKVVATSVRKVKTASINDWTGYYWINGQVYKAKDYNNLEILDRVGGGDGFSAGLIYGLLQQKSKQEIIDIAVASGALTMTTIGDTSMASIDEINSVIKGNSPRIKR